MTFALEPKFVFGHGSAGVENGVENHDDFREDIIYT